MLYSSRLHPISSHLLLLHRSDAQFESRILEQLQFHSKLFLPSPVHISANEYQMIAGWSMFLFEAGVQQFGCVDLLNTLRIGWFWGNSTPYFRGDYAISERNTGVSLTYRLFRTIYRDIVRNTGISCGIFVYRTICRFFANLCDWFGCAFDFLAVFWLAPFQTTIKKLSLSVNLLSSFPKYSVPGIVSLHGRTVVKGFVLPPIPGILANFDPPIPFCNSLEIFNDRRFSFSAVDFGLIMHFQELKTLTFSRNRGMITSATPCWRPVSKERHVILALRSVTSVLMRILSACVCPLTYRSHHDQRHFHSRTQFNLKDPPSFDSATLVSANWIVSRKSIWQTILDILERVWPGPINNHVIPGLGGISRSSNRLPISGAMARRDFQSFRHR
jgi:hypothetical protein